MIRIALAATAFLGATLALVFLLPKGGPGLPEDSAVTRTDSVFSQPSTAPAGPNLPAPTSQVSQASQLIPWIAGGLITAFLHIGLLDLGRFWLTGTWEGFHIELG